MNYELDWVKGIESMFQICCVGWINGLIIILLLWIGVLINVFFLKMYGLNNLKIDVNRKFFMMFYMGYESVCCFYFRKK